MESEKMEYKNAYPNPPKRLGTFIPYVLRNRKKFMVKKNRNRSDKRCKEQDKINKDLVARAHYAYNHKGVYPLTVQEIYGMKRRKELEKFNLIS